MDGKRTAINGWARFIIIIFVGLINYVSKWSILSVSQQYQSNYVRNDVEERAPEGRKSKQEMFNDEIICVGGQICFIAIIIYICLLYVYVCLN